MIRLLGGAVAIGALAACVTNIEEKSAATCATVSSNEQIYRECLEVVRAELDAKNRRTAAIIAAGLTGARSEMPPQPSTTGFLRREFISGVNRVCVYNHLGSEYFVTVNATELCPLSDKR